MNGHNSRLLIALVCGLAAVLIHNLIDFAIFEPGVFGIFWLFIAIIIAQTHTVTGPTYKSASLDASKRLGLFAGLVLVSSVYLGVVLLPPMRAGRFIKQAMTDDVRRVEWIQAGIAADSLSAKTAYKASLMFKQAYQQQRVKDNALLEKASGFARIAAARNPAGFKPWRLLAQIEVLQAEQAEGEHKQKYLQMAFDDFLHAISCYPGSGKLHYNLALVAEQRGQNDVALCHYRTAVEIEDAYRAQFRVMYPERDSVISRIGNGFYIEANFAIKRLTESEMNIENR